MPSIQPTREGVRRKAKRVITDTWQSQANLACFLVLLVLVSFVLPVLGFADTRSNLYPDVAFTLMLVSGIAIAWGRPILFATSCLVALASVVARMADFYTPSPTRQLMADGLSIAAIVVIALALLLQVFGPGPIGSFKIQGAIAVYLLAGSAYAHGYHIVAVLRPGSFAGIASVASVNEWVYYSFSTLTTVGYGDITAVRPVARLLSIGEALTGQLYLAVLIARLVALEVISWQDARAGNA